jgi:hypothetical protein
VGAKFKHFVAERADRWLRLGEFNNLLIQINRTDVVLKYYIFAIYIRSHHTK